MSNISRELLEHLNQESHEFWNWLQKTPEEELEKKLAPTHIKENNLCQESQLTRNKSF